MATFNFWKLVFLCVLNGALLIAALIAGLAIPYSIIAAVFIFRSLRRWGEDVIADINTGVITRLRDHFLWVDLCYILYISFWCTFPLMFFAHFLLQPNTIPESLINIIAQTNGTFARIFMDILPFNKMALDNYRSLVGESQFITHMAAFFTTGFASLCFTIAVFCGVRKAVNHSWKNRKSKYLSITFREFRGMLMLLMVPVFLTSYSIFILRTVVFYKEKTLFLNNSTAAGYAQKLEFISLFLSQYPLCAGYLITAICVAAYYSFKQPKYRRRR